MTEHYSKQIEELSKDLSLEFVEDWEDIFHMALKRALRDLPHITQDAIDHAEALLASCMISARDDGDLIVLSELRSPDGRAGVTRGLQSVTYVEPERRDHVVMAQVHQEDNEQSSRDKGSGDLPVGVQPGTRHDGSPKAKRTVRLRKGGGCVVHDDNELRSVQEDEYLPEYLPGRVRRVSRGQGLPKKTDNLPEELQQAAGHEDLEHNYTEALVSEESLLDVDWGVRGDHTPLFSDRDQLMTPKKRVFLPASLDVLDDDTWSSPRLNNVNQEKQTSSPKEFFKIRRHYNGQKDDRLDLACREKMALVGRLEFI